MKSLAVFGATFVLAMFTAQLYKKELKQKNAAVVKTNACPWYPEIAATKEETIPPAYKHCEKCLAGVYRFDAELEKEICSFCYREP